MSRLPIGTSGYALWALAAGVGIPVMAVLNGALARALGSTAAAVMATCLVGLCTSVTIMLLSGRAPSIAQLLAAPPSLWCGGLIVAFYLYSVARLAPALGAANTILLIMVAQLTTSALIDHFGWLGMPVHRLDAWRTVGLLLVAMGFVTMQGSDSAT
jgi:bacterial/archaeal transporter family-2 protein